MHSNWRGSVASGPYITGSSTTRSTWIHLFNRTEKMRVDCVCILQPRVRSSETLEARSYSQIVSCLPLCTLHFNLFLPKRKGLNRTLQVAAAIIAYICGVCSHDRSISGEMEKKTPRGKVFSIPSSQVLAGML